MRAVVEDPDLVARTGTDPIQVRRLAWVIGCCFAALSGIALVADLGLNALVLTMLVIQAFGAAAIGRFSNLPMTYVGGLFIGVAGSLATKYTASHPSLGGLPPSIPFIVLVVVMIATRPGRLVEQVHRQASSLAALSNGLRLKPLPRIAGAGAVLVLLLAAPGFAGFRINAYSSVLTMGILFLSLSLLVKVSGQVSLGHMGFAAIGASTMAHLYTDAGLPWLLAVLLAAAVAVPVGALVAIPAMRLSGTFLAIATLGFGILLEQLIYPLNFMFSTDQSGLATPRPGGGIGDWRFGSDTGFYYVLLVFAIAVAVLLQVLRRQPFGRILRAMGDAVLPIRTQGGSTNTTLMLAFCLSAFIAGLAGALMASLAQFAVGTAFTSFQSLLLFAVVAVIAVRDPWNALIGAGALVLIPSYAENSTASTYLQLVFGISAMLYVYVAAGSPKGLNVGSRWIPGFLAVSSASAPTHDRVGEAEAPRGALFERYVDPTCLHLEDLVVRYGGIAAVNGVSLVAPSGRITGLIGPNGAGKTSVFNACSGIVPLASGAVRLGSHDLSRWSPQKRAHHGLGRTFQQTQLFDSLSVRENVAMGLEAYRIRSRVLRQLAPGRAHRARMLAAADESLELVGVGELGDVRAGSLSVGQRRLVELARCIAAPFDVVLLDEPSSGLDEAETRAFGRILRKLVDECGIGVLLVEHDMQLVRAVCDSVYVVDFGSVIFEGAPAELAVSDVVRTAYLGDDIEDRASDAAVVPVVP